MSERIIADERQLQELREESPQTASRLLNNRSPNDTAGKPELRHLQQSAQLFDSHIKRSELSGVIFR